MSHFIAGVSKRHSNRMLAAAAREESETDGLLTDKRTRSNNENSPESVSVMLSSTGPVNVHFTMSTGDVPAMNTIELDAGSDDNMRLDVEEIDSDESGDECEDRDEHLHLVRDSDLVGVDVSDCVEEVNEVEFVHRKEEPEAVTNLRLWAIKNRISRNALNTLLKTLREAHGPIHPKCAKTPSHAQGPNDCHPHGTGQLLRFGLKQGILSYRQKELLKMENVLIDIAMDGFQFASSSKIVGWPIFGSIVGFELSPFIIGIYIGDKKRSTVNDFMLPFV